MMLELAARAAQVDFADPEAAERVSAGAAVALRSAGYRCVQSPDSRRRHQYHRAGRSGPLILQRSFQRSSAMPARVPCCPSNCAATAMPSAASMPRVSASCVEPLSSTEWLPRKPPAAAVAFSQAGVEGQVDAADWPHVRDPVAGHREAGFAPAGHLVEMEHLAGVAVPSNQYSGDRVGALCGIDGELQVASPLAVLVADRELLERDLSATADERARVAGGCPARCWSTSWLCR